MIDPPALAEFIRARLTEWETAAQQAPSTIATLFYPADFWTSGTERAHHWDAIPWLFGKKVVSARAAGFSEGSYDPRDTPDVAEQVRAEAAVHMALHDPARVLYQVTAQRLIVDACVSAWEDGSTTEPGTTYNEHESGAMVARDVLLGVAAQWIDHPDYPGHPDNPHIPAPAMRLGFTYPTGAADIHLGQFTGKVGDTVAITRTDTVTGMTIQLGTATVATIRPVGDHLWVTVDNFQPEPS